MFYVSIPQEVLDNIMEKAKATELEIIGFLIGYFEDDTILIEQAVTGEQDSHSTKVSMIPKSIAEITDKILKGEIEGRIMGWYHSHPGFGLFMSPTDICTQSSFQQFSEYVTALIVDPKMEDYAFFTLGEYGQVVRLESEYVQVLSDEEEEEEEKKEEENEEDKGEEEIEEEEEPPPPDDWEEEPPPPDDWEEELPPPEDEEEPPLPDEPEPRNNSDFDEKDG